jgi:hypothetical protein
MTHKLKTVAIAVLAASLVGSQSYAGEPPAPAKKKVATKKAPKPTVEQQIEALRQQLQGQIDGLKSDLASKDAQLRQAQQTAADAQAAASKAQSDLATQQQATSDNAAAVGTLQATVTDMKQANAAMVSSFTDDTTAIKKSIASPDAINFKGVTLSFTGSFLAAETVWREGAVGGDINTPFTGIPLNHANAAYLSEFQGTGRQSRLALRATGKLPYMTMTGYYELDWLGTGITSNNNQSNSYVMRQRQLWADAAMTNGWDFSGGQGWSLATETTQGLKRGTEILPGTIDAQYVAGFVWTRQYSFRVSKNLGKKAFLGFSVENPETLNPAGSNLPTNVLIGSSGTGGGLYNSTANYSFNLAPDLIAKTAFEPGWGHFEVFGIGRFFRDRVYPNETATPPSSAGAYNDSTVAGGIGGGFRGPLAHKKISVGLKGLYGMGVGRYGSSTIADVTLHTSGQIAPLRGFSALSTLEFNPSPRLSIYSNYGGDYIYRRQTGPTTGYGLRTTNMSGCGVEPPVGTAATNGGDGFSPATPANCGNQNKDVQEFTVGYWYYMYRGEKGGLRQGFQYGLFRRDLWSGNGGTANPGGGAQGTDNMWWTSLRYYLP